MSVEEAAETLGLSQGIIYQQIREHQFPGVRIGAKRWVIPIAALRVLFAGEASKSIGNDEQASS